VRARRGRGRLLLPALAGLLAFAGGSGAAPRFVLVFRVSRPHASSVRALALASSFGFDSPSVRVSPSSFAVTDRTGAKELVLYRASGGFDYVDRETYRQAPAGPLLAVEQARRFAVPFLRSHGLLPAGTLRVAARADATVVIVTATPLVSGAPVLDGAITFWLGAGGAITRLRDEYRPLAAPVRVAARPKAAILKEVRDDLGTTTGIHLRLAYVAQPSYLDQPYLDPVFEAVAQGLVLDRVRATTFTPRIEITSPSASTPLLAGEPAALRAKAIEGRGPYRYTWSANATGFLGSGKAVDVPLAAADTEIRLTVRDASGAGMTYAQPVSVIGPIVNPPAAPQSGGTYGDGTVSFETEQDQTHPLHFKDVQAGGVQRESDVYFDQFRYALTVRFQGTDYHVTSRKCVPLTTTGDACELPKGPYAQSAGASPPTGNASSVSSTLAVDNLPGRLELLVEGSAQTAYCGPSGELGAIALGMLPKFVYRTRGKIGGDCPGFRPSLEWSYKPPAVFRPSDFARLCLQGDGICDVPASLLAEWSSLDGGPQPEIADFRLSAYTAVDSHGAGTERAALAKDANDPLHLAASDGAVDTSCRPWRATVGALRTLSRTDAFACIAPVATERSAVLAVPGGRGDWDDLHLKSESPGLGIVFPGCNNPLNDLDASSCIHLHEHWPGGPAEPSSRGQEVVVYVVRSNPGEASPASVEALADGEALRQDADRGYDLVLWHRSTASSKSCFPAGGVDNTDRPCLVFPQAMFFTPR
jgi:hypothetical protein